MKQFIVFLALGACIWPAFAAPKPGHPSPKPSASATKYPQIKTESGLIIQDIVIGKGAQVKPGSICVVNYKGALLGGRVFDSSYARNAPFVFTLGTNDVIKGWEEGLLTMRVGGKRRLIVPPHLGYRDEIVGSIPPDSTLDFEIELLSVKPPAPTAPSTP